MRGFLLFVASRALEERFNEINEYAIGQVVLGRRADFNPNEDNIVRVQARHLRAKLEQYFENEGQVEPMVVTIPKGTYVPTFGPRPQSPAVILPQAPARSWWLPGGKQTLAALVVALAGVLAGGLIWATVARRSESRQGAQVNRNPLLSRVFLTGDSIKIVVSDAGLMLLQDYLHRRVALEDYLRDDYPHSVLPSGAANGLAETLERACRRDHGSYPDILPAARLLQFGQAYQGRAVIRNPRHLNIHDLKSSSLVLLGGPLADPWYALFESRLNFVFEGDYSTGGVWIRNKAPIGRERQTYVPSGGSNPVDFAVIGLLPNLRRSGHVLILAGTSLEGTEAASDMVIREQLPSELLKIFRESKNQDDTVEVLLQTSVVAPGAYGDSKIVAWRIHPVDIQPEHSATR